jgi:hypothetical protein
MKTIQVVLDLPLLRAAKRVHVNRSALVREALRTYQKNLQISSSEHCDRQGYQAQPDSSADFGAWERIEVWPEE